MGRCLIVLNAAICMLGTSARAMTMVECRAQYKADHAAKGTAGMTWHDYQPKRCGIQREPKALKHAPSKQH